MFDELNILDTILKQGGAGQQPELGVSQEKQERIQDTTQRKMEQLAGNDTRPSAESIYGRLALGIDEQSELHSQSNLENEVMRDGGIFDILLSENHNSQDAYQAALAKTSGMQNYVEDDTKERNWSQFAGDTVSAVGTGLANMGLGVAGAGAIATDGARHLLGNALEDAGIISPNVNKKAFGWTVADKVARASDSLNQFARENRSGKDQAKHRIYNASIEEATKIADSVYEQEKELIGETSAKFNREVSLLGTTLRQVLTNPTVLHSTVADGVGSLLGPSIITNLASKVVKGGLETAFMKYGGVTLAIAASTAGSAGMDTITEILDMSHEELYLGTQEYRDLVDSGMDPNEAKMVMANKGGLVSAGVAGVATLPFAGLVARFEADPLRVMFGKSIAQKIGSPVGNIVREGVQELWDESSEEFATNLGVKKYGDDTTDLFEGVGHAGAQGMIGGVGSTSVLYTPKAAAKTVGVAAKPIVDAAKKRVEKIEEERTKNAPHNLDVTKESFDTVSELVSETVEPSEDEVSTKEETVDNIDLEITPEEQQMFDMQSQYDTAIDQVFGLNSKNIQERGIAEPSYVSELGDFDNAVELIEKSSNILTSADSSPEIKAESARMIHELLDTANILSELNQGLNQDSNKLGRAVEDALINVLGNPEVAKAIDEANQYLRENTITATDEELLKEGSTKAQQVAAQAEIAPDMVDPKTLQRVLHQIRRGAIEVNPKIQKSLERVEGLFEAAEVYRNSEEGKDKVSFELRLNQNVDSNQSGYSLYKDINDSIKNNDLESAKNIFTRLGALVTHMDNKLSAMERSTLNPISKEERGDKRAGESFEALVPDLSNRPVKWFTQDKFPVYLNTRSRGSREQYQRTYDDLEFLTKLHNNLLNIHPELSSDDSEYKSIRKNFLNNKNTPQVVKDTVGTKTSVKTQTKEKTKPKQEEIDFSDFYMDNETMSDEDLDQAYPSDRDYPQEVLKETYEGREGDFERKYGVEYEEVVGEPKENDATETENVAVQEEPTQTPKTEERETKSESDFLNTILSNRKGGKDLPSIYEGTRPESDDTYGEVEGIVVHDTGLENDGMPLIHEDTEAGMTVELGSLNPEGIKEYLSKVEDVLNEHGLNSEDISNIFFNDEGQFQDVLAGEFAVNLAVNLNKLHENFESKLKDNKIKDTFVYEALLDSVPKPLQGRFNEIHDRKGGLRTKYKNVLGSNLEGKLSPNLFVGFKVSRKSNNLYANSLNPVGHLIYDLQNPDEASFADGSKLPLMKEESFGVFSNFVNYFTNNLRDSLNNNLNTVLNKNKKDIKKGLEDPESIGLDVHPSRWSTLRSLGAVTKTKMEDGTDYYHYAPEILENALLAATNWFVQFHSANSPLESKDFDDFTNNIIKGYSGVNNLKSTFPEFDYHLQKKMLDNDFFASETLIDSLSNNLKQFIPLDVDTDAGIGTNEGFIKSLAGDILSSLETLNIPQRVQDKNGNYVFEQVPALRRESLSYKYELKDEFKTKNKSHHVIKIPFFNVVNPSKDNIVIQDNLDTIENLSLREKDRGVHYKAKDVKVQTHKDRNPVSPLTKNQREHLKKTTAVPYKVNVGNYKFFTQFDGESLAEFMYPTHGEFDNDYNINHANSLKGQHLSVIQDLSNTIRNIEGGRIDEKGKLIPLEDMEVFFEGHISEENRVHLKGGSNPQTGTLARQILFSSKQTMDLSGENQKDWDDYRRGIAQAIGIKVNNFTDENIFKQVDSRLKDLNPFIKWMAQRITPGKKFSKEFPSKLGEFFDRYNLPRDFVTIGAILDLARLENTEDKSKFETTLYLENDGKSSGPANAIVMSGGNLSSPTYIQRLRAGGIFVGGDSKITSGELMESEDPNYQFKDLYTETGKTLGKISGLSDVGSIMKFYNPELYTPVIPAIGAVKGLVQTLFGDDFIYDPTDDSWTISRNAAKNPSTIKIYGSGTRGIGENFVNALLDDVYKRLSSVLNHRNNPGLHKGKTDAQIFFQDREDLTPQQAQNMYDTLWDNLSIASQMKTVIRRDLNKRVSMPPRINADPKTFTITPKQFEQLSENFNNVITRTSDEALSLVFGSEVMSMMKDNIYSFGMQSNAANTLFKIKYNDLLKRKEENENGEYDGWLKSDGITKEENDQLMREVSRLIPNVKTDLASVTPFKIENIKLPKNSHREFSKSIDNKFSSSIPITSPTNKGVAGVSGYVIGFGDASIYAVDSLESETSQKAMWAHDGKHVHVKDGSQGSEEVNESAFKAWERLPSREMFRNFFYNYVINKVTFKAALLAKDEEALRNYSETLNTVHDREITADLNSAITSYLKDGQGSQLEYALNVYDELTSPLRNGLAEFGSLGKNFAMNYANAKLREISNISIDHMASANNPYYKEGLSFKSTEYHDQYLGFVEEGFEEAKKILTGFHKYHKDFNKNFDEEINQIADYAGVFKEDIASVVETINADEIVETISSHLEAIKKENVIPKIKRTRRNIAETFGETSKDDFLVKTSSEQEFNILINSIRKTSKDERNKKLAKALFTSRGAENTQVEVFNGTREDFKKRYEEHYGNALPDDVYAYFDIESNSIYLDPSGADVSSLAHELVHATTSDYISDYIFKGTTGNKDIDKALLGLYQNFEEVRDKVSKLPKNPEDNFLKLLRDNVFYGDLINDTSENNFNTFSEFLAYAATEDLGVEYTKKIRKSSDNLGLFKKISKALKDFVDKFLLSIGIRNQRERNSLYGEIAEGLGLMSKFPRAHKTIKVEDTKQKILEENPNRDEDPDNDPNPPKGGEPRTPEQLPLFQRKYRSTLPESQGEILGKYSAALKRWLNDSRNKLERTIKESKTEDSLGHTVLSLSAARNAGFEINNESEPVYQAVHMALKTEGVLNSAPLQEAQKVFSEIVGKLTYEDLMNDPNSNDPNERALAQKQYQYLVNGYTPEGKFERNQALADFFALLSVSPDLSFKIGNAVTIDKAKYNYDSVDSIVGTIGQGSLDRIFTLMGGLPHKNMRANEAVNTLIYNLTKIQNPSITTVENALGFISDLAHNVNDKVVDAIQFGSKKVIDYSKPFKESDNLGAKALGLMMSAPMYFVNKEYAEAGAEHLMEFANHENAPKAFRELISDLTGKSKSNKPVYDLIKKSKVWIQERRQGYRETLPTVLSKLFKEEPSKDSWKSMKRVLGDGDLISLLQFSNFRDFNRILSNDFAKNFEISKLEDTLSKLVPVHWSAMKRKSEELARFMITGEVSPNQLRNAEAISMLQGEMNQPDYKFSKHELAMLDKYISLLSMQYMDESDINSVRMLIDSDPEGVKQLSNFMLGLKNAEDEKAENTTKARANRMKGYLPHLAAGNNSIIVADDKDYARLRSIGYERIGDYKGSSYDPGRMVPKGYYYSPTARNAPFHQGIMQNIKLTVGGIDDFSGKSEHSQIELITSVKEVKEITKNLRTNKTVNREGLTPIYANIGDKEPIAYERQISKEMADLAKPEENLAILLGAQKGRLFEENIAGMLNEVLVDAMDEMYRKADDKESYVNIFDPELLEKDKVLADAMSLLPRDIRLQMENMHGENTFYVRRDMLNDAFGYRMATIGDFWTGKNNFSGDTQKAIVTLATSIMGDNAYNMLMKAQDTIQNFTAFARENIVVRSMVVPAINLIANYLQAFARGVPVVYALKHTPRIVAEMEHYHNNQRKIIELEVQLHAHSQNPNKAKKIQTQIDTLKKSNQMLTVYPLIEAGEYTTISDRLIEAPETKLTEGKWDEYFEGLVDKLPEGIKTAGKYAIISRDTPLYKGLKKSVDYGDFLTKAIQYEYFTKVRKKDPEDVMNGISEEYINYDKLQGRFRHTLENLGLSWFWNWKLRASKIGLSILRNNPLFAIYASNIPTPDMFGFIGLPYDDGALFRVFNEQSLTRSLGPAMGVSPIAMNPWIGLMSR